MLYSVDTSSLIDAWTRFPPDIVVSLWEELIPGLIASGDLRATREVEVELKKRESELAAWATHEDQDKLFLEVDRGVQTNVEKILGSHPNLIDPEGTDSGADPFVIALAMQDEAAVVTQERPAKDPKNKPKIPDVCEAYDIPCFDFLDLVRDQDWHW